CGDYDTFCIDRKYPKNNKAGWDCDFPSRLDHPPLKRFYTVKLIRHGTLGQLVCKSSLVLGREPGKYILVPVFVNIVLLFFTNKEVFAVSVCFPHQHKCFIKVSRRGVL
ncbi:MAG: hypothetical protein J6L92_08530, partial [Clostridia bacterium]|nr:hypothetical protein [Clostridia bacterium]